MANETTVNVSHTEAAQGTIEKIRALRQEIPNLVIPQPKQDGRQLASAASVPPQFVEMSASAMTNSSALVNGASETPDAVRDLINYAEAYTVVAEEAEALGKVVRHSVAVAKNKAGRHALNAYAQARRLAKQPETAELKPVADALRRTLGRKGKKSKAQPQPAPTTPEPPSNETPQK